MNLMYVVVCSYLMFYSPWSQLCGFNHVVNLSPKLLNGKV